MYVSTPFSSSDSCSSFRPSKTPSGSSESTSPSSSSSSSGFPSGSTSASVTASQSIGRARPLFARMAAFFFACCSTNRSSSATQAASCASATGRFAGTFGRGGIAAVIGWEPLGSSPAMGCETPELDFCGDWAWASIMVVMAAAVVSVNACAATRLKVSSKQSSGSRQEKRRQNSSFARRAVPRSLTLLLAWQAATQRLSDDLQLDIPQLHFWQ